MSLAHKSSLCQCLSQAMAEGAFRTLVVWLGGAFGGILLFANVAVAIVTRKGR